MKMTMKEQGYWNKLIKLLSSIGLVFFFGCICSVLTIVPVLDSYIDISSFGCTLIVMASVGMSVILFWLNPLEKLPLNTALHEVIFILFISQMTMFIMVICNNKFVVPEVIVPGLVFMAAGSGSCVGMLSKYILSECDTVLAVSLFSLGFIAGVFSHSWVLCTVNNIGLRAIVVPHVIFSILLIVNVVALTSATPDRKEW